MYTEESNFKVPGDLTHKTVKQVRSELRRLCSIPFTVLKSLSLIVE